MDVLEAIRNGSSGPELAERELPETHVAAHLRVEDMERMLAAEDGDVRDSIHVGPLPVPEVGPDEVLIAVMASAINYNTVWSALYRPVPTFAFLQRFAEEGGWAARHLQPYHVIGSDAAGIVVRVGVAVTRWKVGDHVVASPSWVDDQDPAAYADAALAAAPRAWGYETNFGGLAELALTKANQLLPKAPHLTWEEAACNSLCAVTAYRMLVSPNGARMKQGDVVLVWGAAGGLGSYAIQYIRNGGGISVGVVSSDEKERLLERLGCDLVLRRDRMDLEGLPEKEMRRAFGRAIRDGVGEDPHIVFDYVGEETFPTSVYLARRGGSVVTCGSSTGYRHEFDNRYLWMRVKRIIGSHGANWAESWEANRLISLGKVVPALSSVHPLREAGEATREVQLGRHVGKVGVLCLAEREGTGVEDTDLRERIGEDRLRLFRGDHLVRS